jgi:hypothetical protein
MDLESVWYEVFPFLYGVAGFVALWLSSGSTLLKISGILLLAACFTILRVRWVYRRSIFVHLPSADELTKSTEPGSESEPA